MVLPVCTRELFDPTSPANARDLKRYPLCDRPMNPGVCGAIRQPKPAGRRPRRRLDDSLTVLAAAEQGQGLALTRGRWWRRICQRPGGAREPAGFLPCPRAYYFVCPESYLALPKLQQLLKWLVRWLRPSEARRHCRSQLAKAQRPSQLSARPHGAQRAPLSGASAPAAQGHQVRQQPRVQTLNAQRVPAMPGRIGPAAVS